MGSAELFCSLPPSPSPVALLCACARSFLAWKVQEVEIPASASDWLGRGDVFHLPWVVTCPVSKQRRCGFPLLYCAWVEQRFCSWIAALQPLSLPGDKRVLAREGSGSPLGHASWNNCLEPFVAPFKGQTVAPLKIFLHFSLESVSSHFLCFQTSCCSLWGSVASILFFCYKKMSWGNVSIWKPLLFPHWGSSFTLNHFIIFVVSCVSPLKDLNYWFWFQIPKLKCICAKAVNPKNT